MPTELQPDPVHACGVSIASLVRQYDRPGPRYTSYPTAVEFNDHFDEAAYRGRLQAAAATDDPLSLYVHLPFCEERCSYCGCAVIATRRREVAAKYLGYLEKELALLAGALGGRRHLAQMHWGGGTPTYLTVDQLRWLHAAVERHFRLQPEAECAVEIDPRVTTGEQIRALRDLGFNRLSMGVQDFACDVQAAIGRRQSENQTRGLFAFARHVGFASINVDLVYGLPRQGIPSFTRTLESVVSLRPDRIAVYSYAHVPWLRPSQKAIHVSDLPTPVQKIELIGAAIETFLDAGYVAIGMDHFALPDDDLAIAARERRLHRNFMGYTTKPAADVLGVGVSSIGDVRGAFAQNVKKLPHYYEALDAGRFPIERGYALSVDDMIRRHVISELMCNFHVDRSRVEQLFAVDFDTYFAAELEQLAAPGGPAADGLLEITPDALTVTPRGRLFVRTICMQFDQYLAAHRGRSVFSRTV
ncbi:MAG TPA: oxygen-independent coproporphyrinogen III oxidase [Vicinamibacterales bacterium]|nr:oxygen-independent coproporphyrinogen III oxidase [Vicinamibacterales bacterium]